MESALRIVSVRCEYRVNPLGIDVLRPSFSWKLEAEARNVFQSAYRVVVATCENFKNIVWDSGKVLSDQSVHVEYEGQTLKPRTRYYYKVQVWDNRQNECWSEVVFWETGLLGETWTAEWITPGLETTACPLMRTTFSISKSVRSARIYVTALGLYELELNGVKVGDALFTPGWTAYNKRLQYQTYDITDFLSSGINVVGAILGNGWYKGRGWEGKTNLYGDKLALLCQIHVAYEDGSEDVFGTNENWRVAEGPILMSEIYHGETYDARLARKGWSRADYTDADWANALILKYPKDSIIAQEGVPVKAIETIKPVQIIHTPKGETVLDFGQNMVGWVRFSVEAAAGWKVILKHAEILDKDGNFYVDNLKTAQQTIIYTTKGEGREVYEPRFTFQGFRYVQLVEYPGTIQLDNFEGIVIHSDMEKTGTFACSNELVNQLQKNIVWGQKGNFLDIPTDCPQRDERLGWTGDAQVFARTACFNMDTALFFKKWLGDVKAEQMENGGVPLVIPNVFSAPVNTFISAGWSDVAVILPWTIYLCFGDVKILSEHYISMKAYVEYIRGVAEDEVLWNSGPHFGDWLALDAGDGSYKGATPKELVATAYYAYVTDILAKSAALLKQEQDEEFYRNLHRKIVEAYQQEFYTPKGRLAAQTQTAHVLSLMFDLVEEQNRQRTIDTLVRYLEENQWHLKTGFLGTPYLCHVLSRNGRADVAYKLLLATDYPSWLYQVTKGATTIWEHWDGVKEDGSFWSADMNSFNHYAYGAVGDWLYREVAGIELDESKPGYKRIVIKPALCTALTWAEAELESMYGLIKSRWKREEAGDVNLAVTIPPNTTAKITLPYAKRGSVTESGQTLESLPLVVEQDASGITVELASGSYNFSYAAEVDWIPDIPATIDKMPWE